MPKTILLEGRPTGWLGAITMPLRVGRRLLTSGFSSTLRRVKAKASIAYFEWRYRLKTESFIPWNELSNDACSVDYEPTTYSAIRSVLKHVDDCDNAVLLDYGCGLGRVLAMAIRFGCRKAVGVELSAELCKTAQDNLQRSLGDDSSRVEVICENAAEWPTPDEATVIYLFNPFRGRVLEETLDRIRESLIRRPRGLKILYLQPLVDENVLQRRPWLRLEHEETLEGVRFCVFAHQP